MYDMLYYYNMEQSVKQIRDPIRKAHYVGTSVVVTIDQSHVKRLRIDDMTFFVEKPTENGIILEIRKFDTQWKGVKRRNETRENTAVPR